MKSMIAGALLAALTNQYELTAYEQKAYKYFMDDKVYVKAGLKWDFSAGYRNPMRWAKYESWHETMSWSYEIYTASKLKLPF